MTDPNVQQTDSGDEVILEPGDPGYVEPGTQTDASGQPIQNQPETTPGPDEPLGAIAPPGEDLQHVRERGEGDAEFAARTRNVVVESQSPTDIVPNTPQISMGPRVPVEGTEGAISYATAPVEAEPSVAEPVDDAPAEEAEAPAEEAPQA